MKSSHAGFLGPQDWNIILCKVKRTTIHIFNWPLGNSTDVGVNRSKSQALFAC